MKFFLDHDVPADVARVLEQEGHAALTLRQALPSTAGDAEVLRYAAQNEMVMITCNRGDFLQLAKAHSHCGLIILIRRKSRHQEFSKLLSLVRRAGESGLRGNINFA